MKTVLFFVAVIFIFSSCVMMVNSNSSVLGSGQSQVELRNFQSRIFDTDDTDGVIRNIMSTMQDLGFIIDRADRELGSVSGYSFSSKTTLTVTVRTRASQTVVRANAQAGTRPITAPKAYQNFFNALSQSLFLAANEVL
ncbi:MAG: hypothetical protein LBU55_03690 [Elusimicrobiota bacterium]|nr:hypothetical protein [Elusimicrobiota bacterium]